MPTYSWTLPTPSSPSSPAPTIAALAGATSRTALGGLLDQFVDPTTLDYVDTDDGAWLETADSRSIVLCMIEMRLGKSYSAPRDGTSIKDRLEIGDPVTPAEVVVDVERALALLVADGLIDDVTTNPTEDETGRFTLELHWRDLATGSPIDLVYTPFQG